MTCCICGRPRPAGYTSTCGRSHCQEADYHRNAAKNARKGSQKAAEHLRKAAAAGELAERRLV